MPQDNRPSLRWSSLVPRSSLGMLDAVAGSCKIFLYSYLKNGNCVLCVCCSGRRLRRLGPGPSSSSCSSLRRGCFLFVLLLVFIVFLLSVLFTLLQSTVGVGSCFSCAYLYMYVHTHIHTYINVYLYIESENACQEYNGRTSQCIRICICLLVYCAGPETAATNFASKFCIWVPLKQGIQF